VEPVHLPYCQRFFPLSSETFKAPADLSPTDNYCIFIESTNI